MTLDPLHLIILALAVFRITRLLVEDEILSGPRDWFWSKFPPERTKLGYLLTCVWCTSFWVALLVVGLYLLIPGAMIVIALIFALSAVVGIIDNILNR